MLDHERYDRIVLTAAANGDDGFTSTQTAWLLNHASGEVVVLRPDQNGSGGSASHHADFS